MRPRPSLEPVMNILDMIFSWERACEWCLPGFAGIALHG